MTLFGGFGGIISITWILTHYKTWVWLHSNYIPSYIPEISLISSSFSLFCWPFCLGRHFILHQEVVFLFSSHLLEEQRLLWLFIPIFEWQTRLQVVHIHVNVARVCWKWFGSDSVLHLFLAFLFSNLSSLIFSYV